MKLYDFKNFVIVDNVEMTSTPMSKHIMDYVNCEIEYVRYSFKTINNTKYVLKKDNPYILNHFMKRKDPLMLAGYVFMMITNKHKTDKSKPIKSITNNDISSYINKNKKGLDMIGDKFQIPIGIIHKLDNYDEPEPKEEIA